MSQDFPLPENLRNLNDSCHQVSTGFFIKNLSSIDDEQFDSASIPFKDLRIALKEIEFLKSQTIKVPILGTVK